MIYLSPLMLIGTALVLQSRKIDWRLVAAATAFVLFLVFEQADPAGLPVLRGAGLRDPHDPEPALGLGRRTTCSWASSACSSLGLVAARVPPAHGRRRRGRRALLRVDADLRDLLDASASTTSRTSSARSLPAQLDWVDQATGGQPVTYLGQVGSPRTRTACCSPSSGTARCGTSTASTAARPGPGPTGTPDIVSTDGRLSRIPPDTQYVLADNGVNAAGARRRDVGRQLRSTARRGPWRLSTPSSRSTPTAGRRDWSTYTYFRPGQHGTLERDAVADGLQRQRAARPRAGRGQHRRLDPRRGGRWATSSRAPGADRERQADRPDPGGADARPGRDLHHPDVPRERVRPARPRRAGGFKFVPAKGG